jgi:hypothetical protein
VDRAETDEPNERMQAQALPGGALRLLREPATGREAQFVRRDSNARIFLQQRLVELARTHELAQEGSEAVDFTPKRRSVRLASQNRSTTHLSRSPSTKHVRGSITIA